MICNDINISPFCSCILLILCHNMPLDPYVTWTNVFLFLFLSEVAASLLHEGSQRCDNIHHYWKYFLLGDLKTHEKIRRWWKDDLSNCYYKGNSEYTALLTKSITLKADGQAGCPVYMLLQWCSKVCHVVCFVGWKVTAVRWPVMTNGCSAVWAQTMEWHQKTCRHCLLRTTWLSHTVPAC